MKEERDVFKAGDDLSSKQEDGSLEAEAKRFKSFHEVKGMEVQNPKAVDSKESSEEALNSFFNSFDAEVPILLKLALVVLYLVRWLRNEVLQ